MRTKAKRSRKSISSAPGLNLSQVKLFSSLDCPVNVGTKYLGKYQQNLSGMLHSSSLEANDGPPGFEVGISMKRSKRHLPIPRIKWMCPPKLVMSDDWCVVAGEESVEAKTQKTIEEESEEDRDHEFLTPASTTVVSQPLQFSEGLLVSKTETAPELSTPGFYQVPAPGKLHNQSADFTTVISAALTAMIKSSEKESMIDTDLLIKILSQGLLVSETKNATKESNPPGFYRVPPTRKLPNQCADFRPTVSSAASTSTMKSSEQESMIDKDLLMKILNDPKMIQKLINVQGPQGETGTASLNTHTTPSSKMVTSGSAPNRSYSDIPRTPSGNLDFHMPGKASATLKTIPVQRENVQISGLKQAAPLPPPLPSFSMPPADHSLLLPTLANQTQAPSSMVPQQKTAPLGLFQGPGIVKDMNYYKNLIRQHGTDYNQIREPICPKNGDNFKHLDLKMSLNSHPSEMKAKSLKRCIFFESAKGCNGANCEFVHDMSLNWRTGMKAQSAKRIKLNGFCNKGGPFFRI